MHSPLITFILKALSRSSRFLYRDYFELELQQSSKGSKNDFVQKANKKCEELIKAELEKYNDKISFKIIPIDGIDNFSRSIPFFSIVIVAYNKEDLLPVASVIDCPILGETYYAEKGSGMWLEKHNNNSAVNSGVRLRVSNNKENFMFLLGEYRKLEQNSITRILGCNSYSICLVAAGKADIAHITEINPILLSVAKLLMQEAGGKIISDNPLILSNGYSSIQP